MIDSNGVLKIADFGLATSYDPDNPQPLTSRVVTLWYRPPELLLGATEYGVAVDMWSTGCIVAELFAGKPIMPGRTEVFLILPLKIQKQHQLPFRFLCWLKSYDFFFYNNVMVGGANSQDL